MGIIFPPLGANVAGSRPRIGPEGYTRTARMPFLRLKAWAMLTPVSPLAAERTRECPEFFNSSSIAAARNAMPKSLNSPVGPL